MAKRKDSKKRVLKEGEYQRSNGSFEYKWRDKQGKRHSVYAKTLEELREKEKALLKNILDGVRTPNKSLTVNDLYYRWLGVKRGLRDSTLGGYKEVYARHVESQFGLTKLTDLKKSDVKAFYNYLVEQKGLSVSSVDGVHAVLHQVLGIALDDELIRSNPADKALVDLKKAHAGEAKKRKALTVQEQAAFERFLWSNKWYRKWIPIFTLMLHTGLRVGEATSLRWCDVDFEHGTISVNHTLAMCVRDGRHVNTIHRPKTKAGERTVPMLPIVKEALLMEKQFQDEFGIRCDMEIDGYTDFIFLNHLGHIRQGTDLNRTLRQIVESNNKKVSKGKDGYDTPLPPMSNHTLRHTFTTRMCEAGVNVKAMQEILGHSRIEVTMNIYAEATEDLKRAEMIDLAAYLGTGKPA